MRDKIIDYLENDLSPTERQVFERQLAIDPDLQAELVVQQGIMTKLHDAHLRQQAQAQLGNWKKHADEFKQHQFRKQVLIWGSILGIAALAAWALFRYFDKVFDETEVAQKPVFAQGEQAFQKYLKDSLIDKNTNNEPVEVTFVVEKDNSITNVKVLHCNNKAFEQEILRFIKAMPNWKAGRHKNKLVRVQMTIAIPKQSTLIEGQLASNPVSPQAIPLWRVVDSLQLKLAPLNASLGSDSDKQERLQFNQKLEAAKQHPYEFRYSYLPMLSNPITPEEKFVVALSATKQKDWETAQLYLSELGKLSNINPTLKKSVDELAKLTQQLKSLSNR